MADFDVKVRNLETGETMVASMPDCETCIAWLTERPPFIEIISVLSDTSPAEQRRLKEAMRPYNSAERSLKQKYDDELAAGLQAAYQDELARIESDQSAADEEDANADPNRPIAIKYDSDEGLRAVEDKREISDLARNAVLAWVRERNTWIDSKGQIIGEAHLEVWPGEMPADETERVREGGRFFPRLKPEN